MLLALLLLQQLLIGLAGVNHESFVKADGFSAWLFPICMFSSFLRTTFVSSKSDSPTMTKTGREGRDDQKMLSHNLFKVLPMIGACWAIHNLLQRCLENPEYTFQPTKNLLKFPPISVSYDSRKVRFHQWKTTASPHPSLSCRSRQTSAPRHVITFPTVVTLVLKAAATSEAS